MLKASTSSWQNCTLLLLQRNSCLSNFFAWSLAIRHALLWRVWLHLQPPIGQPSHPQTEDTPPPGPRDLGGPLRDNSCRPGAAAWWKPSRLIPFPWDSEQRRWHPFRRVELPFKYAFGNQTPRPTSQDSTKYSVLPNSFNDIHLKVRSLLIKVAVAEAQVAGG